MDFEACRETIGNMFSSGKTFVIPRFQREYSWEIAQCKIFYGDLLKNIKVNGEGELQSTDYFWGSVLLVGDWNSSKEMTIVDGQQRLTTMTIFLSALHGAFKLANFDEGVVSKIWEKIIGRNDDGEEFVVLKNTSAEPFFQELIQTQRHEASNRTAEEHEAIKAAYDYFKEELLDEDKVKSNFGGSFSYQECLKAIRDQLLKGFVIRISTNSSETAGVIYENINSKGLPLDPVDLIKNELFMKLATTVPTDSANNLWKNIRKNLAGEGGGEYISMSAFFRHFWNSSYGRSADKDLFKNFKKTVKTQEYYDFLSDMEKKSRIYAMIARPSLASQEYSGDDLFIVDALKNFNNVFKIVQTRIILLSLLAAYSEDRISSRQLRDILDFLENFHFAYTGLYSGRTNRFNNKYIKFAQDVSGAATKEKMGVVLQKFKRDVDSLFPSQNDFVQKFCTKLEFSKFREDRDNALAKFAVNKLESSFSGLDRREDASVEHIINEDRENSITQNIGNLILLEKRINSEIPQRALTLADKKPFYRRSSYSHMQKFLEEWETFSVEDIGRRAKALAKVFYTQILHKQWDDGQPNE